MQEREAELDQDRIRACAAAVSVPLVLHGSSGVKHESIRGGDRERHRKINVGTYLPPVSPSRCAVRRDRGRTRRIRARLLAPARDEVRERVREKIRLFRSSGMAAEGWRESARQFPSVSFAAVE